MTEQDKIKHLRRCVGNLLKGLNQPGATLDSPDVQRGLIGIAKLIEQQDTTKEAEQERRD